jgi:hypothetical protein
VEGLVVEGKGGASEIAGQIGEVTAQVGDCDVRVHPLEVEVAEDLVLDLLRQLGDLFEVGRCPVAEWVVRFGEHLLPMLREIAVDSCSTGYPSGCLAESRGYGVRIAFVEHQQGMDSIGLFERMEVLAAEVFLDRDLGGFGRGHLADDGRDIEGGRVDPIQLGQVETGSANPSLAGHELVAPLVQGPKENRLDHALRANGACELEQVRIIGVEEMKAAGLVEAGTDVPQRNLLDC